MKKVEYVYRELLYQAMERSNRRVTQSELAKTLRVSLSTVNLAIKPLRRMRAVDVKPRALAIIDAKKILYYWASMRNIEKDTVYSTRADMAVNEIEKSIPDNAVYGAYTAYKLKFKDVPADYSEIYVYGDINERFPKSESQPNIFALKKDALMERYGKTTTLAQTFVDLWNLKEWYAKEFVKEMEAKLHGILE